ncbi:MAG: two-component regulator propeller domain-containing protein [Bacteroidales bacterium]|nr:two-component regulator propeller domain-containing protein [Bacteroidales bacterium]
MAFIVIIVTNIHTICAQGQWTILSTSNTGSNGLMSNGVTGMAKDTSGYIWISTDRGVSMYNHEEWVTQFPFDSVPGSFGIKSIAVDKNNNVWTANMMSKGVSKYDGNTWTIYNNANGLPNESIDEICPADSIIWFGTNQGLIKYDGNAFTHVNFGSTFLQVVKNPQTGQNDTTKYYTNYNISALAVDQNNNLWVSGYDYAPGVVASALKMYDGSVWTSYTTDDGLIDSLIVSISIDNSGNIWFGSRDKGVSKFDFSTFTNYTKSDGLISDSIESIACDSSGNVWFGTRVGASRFDGSNWTSFNSENGLSLKYIDVLLAGNNSDIWLGSGGGISLYNGIEYTDYTTRDGLIDNWINDIEGTDKGVWFDTERGASFFDGTTWNGYDSRNGLSGITIEATEDDSFGRIWFGIINAGVTILNGEDVIVLEGNQFRNAKDFLEDKSGNIWLGGTGLCKFDGVDWSYIPTNNLAPYGAVNSLALDSSNNIWVGFTLGIIGKYDGSSWSTDTLYCGGANAYINSIVVDSSGMVWSYSKGLFKFDGNNWRELTTTDGFMHSIVNGLAIDKNNKLWITTNDGVTSYDGINFIDYPSPNGLILENAAADPFNNKWFRLAAYGVARYCESMWISGTVSYDSVHLTDGLAFIYSVNESEIKLISTVNLDTNGKYSFPVDHSGYYVVSANADADSSSYFLETYFNSAPNTCNQYEIIELHCGDSIANMDIALFDTTDVLSANYFYSDNGNGNYSFTNRSQGNFNMTHWAFGDGYTSNETNPEHTFNTNGTYLIVLTIRDSTSTVSCFDYFIDTLVVTEVELPLQCNAGFVIFPDTTLDNITIVNSSVGDNLSYYWDFGDGITSIMPYPNHTYMSPGPFHLCLTVDDGNGCYHIYCDSVGINGVVFREEGFNINIVPLTVTETNYTEGLNLEINILPNPASGYLSIESEILIEKINIISINGRNYKTVTSGFDKISVEDLPSGVYILNCITAFKSANKKFIKY